MLVLGSNGLPEPGVQVNMVTWRLLMRQCVSTGYTGMDVVRSAYNSVSLPSKPNMLHNQSEQVSCSLSTAAAADIMLSSNEKKVIHRKWNSNVVFTLRHL
jgi:hypothetical protein